MTLPNQTPFAGPYTGNGSTTGFAYGFQIDAESELVVVKRDETTLVETTLVLTTDYTVTGVGNASGGTFTTVTAPTANETISARRSTTPNQEVDLQNLAAFVPETQEEVYDKLTKLIQELNEKIGRALLVQGNSGLTLNLPAPEASKLLGWNAAGTDLQNYTPNTDALITLPAGSTDNAVVRFDGTGGDAFADSNVLVQDDGRLDLEGTDRALNTSGSDIGIQVAATDAARFSATQANLLIGGTGRFRLTATGLRLSANDAAVALDLQDKTDAVHIPTGTTAQRPTPAEGMIRRNTTTSQFEGYDGSSWGGLGGAGLFKGENGESGDVVSGAGDIFRVHEQELNTNTTIDADENAVAVGPLTIATGVTLTVTSGGNLSIV